MTRQASGERPSRSRRPPLPLRLERRDVSYHRRGLRQPVAFPQAVGDSLGHGDHPCGAGHPHPLNDAHGPGPGPLPVGNAGGELVRVVEQVRTRKPGSHESRQQHGCVVGMDHVRPEAQGRLDELEHSGSAVQVKRKPAGDPGGGSTERLRTPSRHSSPGGTGEAPARPRRGRPEPVPTPPAGHGNRTQAIYAAASRSAWLTRRWCGFLGGHELQPAGRGQPGP